MKNNGVIALETKIGRQYNNFQTVPHIADKKKYESAKAAAQAQAEYEVHCLL